MIKLRQEIYNLVAEAVEQEFGLDFGDFDVAIPDNPEWGDYSTNVGMRLASVLKQSPVDIAKKLAYKIEVLNTSGDKSGRGFQAEVAGNGYINFKISFNRVQNILNNISQTPLNYREVPKGLRNTELEGKKIMVEYTDPNPFKLFHIGHLTPNTVGESLARLFEFCGAQVKRANYQGDAGMHVAKSLWGMEQKLFSEELSLEDIGGLSVKERVEFLGESYALGASAYKEDSAAKEQIRNYNYLVYVSAQEVLQEREGWEPLVDYRKYLKKADFSSEKYEKISRMYRAGRKWSLEYFETVYKILGTQFDYYYFESVMGEYGFDLVHEYLGQGVFEKDKDAVIFRGEKYGLHNRVFINSQGLPTYESKDLALAFRKKEDFDYDLSYIVTANEIDAYFDVVLKALSLINPELAGKTVHVSHAMLKLKDGKMSSRTGQVIEVDELLFGLAERAYKRTTRALEAAPEKEKRKIAQEIAVASLKYAILRQQLNKDIVYDRESSLALTGDTGPYLQYTYVRAHSILEKAGFSWRDFSIDEDLLGAEELLLARHLLYFNEKVEKAAEELMPSCLCTYLHKLAGLFNTFYSKAPILEADDANLRNFRLNLTNATGVVLKTGLSLLGINTVTRM